MMFEMLKDMTKLRKMANEFSEIIRTKEVLDKELKNGEISKTDYNEQIEVLMVALSEGLDVNIAPNQMLKLLENTQKQSKQFENIIKLQKSGLITKEQAKGQMMKSMMSYLK